MVVNPDGSGNVTVTIDVDKEIVQRSPDIADNLDFSDLEKNGWQLTKPVDTASGGKQVVLVRNFANESEATAVLAQLNGDRGPFREVILRRGGKVAQRLEHQRRRRLGPAAAHRAARARPVLPQRARRGPRSGRFLPLAGARKEKWGVRHRLDPAAEDGLGLSRTDGLGPE